MKKSVLNGFVIALLVTILGLAGCHQTKKTESKTTTSSKAIKKKSTSQSKDKKKKTKTSSSTTESTTKQTSTTKEQTTQSKTKTSQTPQTEKTTMTAKPAAQPTILDTLVGKNFVFSSGTGGWSTTLSIGPNSTFSGVYHDSDMGVTGPGYPGGTVSYSKFSGQFKQVHQLNPNLYEMYIENLQYENPVGGSEIKEGQKYDYTEAYGISKNHRMAIYLPGTQISALPEEFRVYSGGRIPEGSQTLPFYVIQGDMEGFFIEYH